MGILMDLGVSSAQLDRPERGFSYRFDAPLDMRMDAKQSLTAADVVNGYDESRARRRHLAVRRGAVRAAHRARDRRGPARRARRASSPTIVRDAIPAATRRRGPHPARRTFQAIRMEVNRELPNLADGLDESVHVDRARGSRARARVPLARGPHGEGDLRALGRRRRRPRRAGQAAGRRRRSRTPLVRVLTRRPLRPSADEVAANPRAESARLRAVERLDDLPDIPDLPDIVA